MVPSKSAKASTSICLVAMSRWLVGPEVAEILAQLAPGDQQASSVQIADGDGPDDAFGRALLLVAILKAHLLAGVDAGANLGQVERILHALVAVGRAQGGVEQKGAQALGDRGQDLGLQVQGGAGQGRIADARDPLGAQDTGFDLVGRQHQGRQIEPALQHIAHARFAPDRHPLADEGGDVAIDGALGGLQLGRDQVGRVRPAPSAQDLDDLEQAVGASHDPGILPQC